MFRVKPAKKPKKVQPPKKTRGPRGEGTVFPDKRRGGFRGKVPVGRYSDGRTRYKEVWGATQAECVAAKKRVQPPGPEVTVKEWAERWLAGLTNRPSTRAVYAHSMNRHIVPEVGHVRVAELTVSQVKAAAARWKGLRPQTINLTLDRGATMFRAAIVDGLATANPFALCPRRECERKPIDPFSPEELRAVIADWRACRLGPMFALLALTGCREGEAAALDVTDYDPATGALKITKTHHPKHGIGPPKSKYSVRTLTVPATAPEVRAALAHASGGRTKGPLFVTGGGRRVHHKAVFDSFAARLKKLGLRNRSPHKLRHGVATALISAGVPIGDVARWMGDTEEMIVRTYLHPTGTDVGAALGRILGG